MQGIPIKEKLS